jgi:ferredoxin
VLLREVVPEEHRAPARRAEANCPERAIRIEEDSQ